MNTFKHLCLLKLFFFMGVFTTLQAQYGTGSDGNLNIPASNTVYTDDVRAQVHRYESTATAAPSPYVITLTIKCENVDLTSDLNPNDLLMIVDHVQSGRNYDLADVVSSSYVWDNDLSAWVTEITATCWRTDNSTPNIITNPTPASTRPHTQVIRVPQWEDVTLNAGSILTCHKYDDPSGIPETGGILAFLCNGTLNFNGGSIFTKGKGQKGFPKLTGGAGATIIPPSNNGIAGTNYGEDGTSAYGGTAFPTFEHKGGVQPIINGSGCAIQSGGEGGCGGNSLDGEYGPSQYDALSKADFSTLTISFGHGGLAGRPGQGPGAGGHGGGGGAGAVLAGSGAATDGELGNAPVSGSHGGDGGAGGRGGGMVYVKAAIVHRTTASTVTYTLGSNNINAGAICTDGESGSQGGCAEGNGGNGGAGGKGGNGGCASGTFYGPGGGGGHGTPGNGGDGGFGGNGGDAGDVWILIGSTPAYGQAQSFYITSQNDYDVRVIGGLGGPAPDNSDPNCHATALGGATGHGEWEYWDGSGTIILTSNYWNSSMGEMTPPLWNGNAPIDGCVASSTCDPSCIDPVVYGEVVDQHDVSCDAYCLDCDEAMWLLSMMRQQTTLPNGNIKYFDPDPAMAAIEGISLNSHCLKTSEGLYAWYVDINTAGTCNAPGDADYRSPTHHCDFTDPTNPIWDHITSFGAATVRTAATYIEWTSTSLPGTISYTFSSGTAAWPTNSESACSPGGGGGTGGSAENVDRPRPGKPGEPGEAVSVGNVTKSPPAPSGGNPWWWRELGIEESEQNVFSLELTPMPAQNFLSIKASVLDHKNITINIYDLNGKLILSQQQEANGKTLKKNIDVSSIPAGSYIFSITQGQNQQNKPIIIQH